ncbi:hypothetical protein AB6F62_16590 [Providencia huaxiensis]|uniref:hypothetical protein n=1 Tax=Providencia huaxiensis TaxID=2027290 RepID=UPI0034DD0986
MHTSSKPSFMLRVNRDGQLYLPAEFTPDEILEVQAKRIRGAQVTCSPASVGTTMIRFKSEKTNIDMVH